MSGNQASRRRTAEKAKIICPPPHPPRLEHKKHKFTLECGDDLVSLRL